MTDPAATEIIAAIENSGVPQAISILSALLVALAFFLLIHSTALAQESPKSAAGSLRIGIVHARPHLCDGREYSQRDIRVLRLAFGVGLRPRDRLKPPWYLHAVPIPDSEFRGLALDTPALWGFPRFWLYRLPPDFWTQPPFNPLHRWQARLLYDGLGGTGRGTREREPEHEAPAVTTPAKASAGRYDLILPRQPVDGLFWSRLHGTPTLPRLDGYLSSDFGPDCPMWPAGIWLAKSENGKRYRFTSRRTGPPGAFTLASYLRLGTLWKEFRRGRLDVILIEGGDLADLARTQRVRSKMVWGSETGTQQIVLRPSPALAAALDSRQWRALSLGVHRQDLAGVFPTGSYRATARFMAPVLGAPKERNPDFDWQPREARRSWLAEAGEILPIRIVTLAHPALETLARRLAEQWKKTLNLSVTWDLRSIESFATDREKGDFELRLEVVDLDDGSLQDLWRNALQNDGPDTMNSQDKTTTSEGIEAWEKRMSESWPYLPLLEKQHFFVSRGKKAQEHLRQICPACRIPATPAAIRNLRSQRRSTGRTTPEEG